MTHDVAIDWKEQAFKYLNDNGVEVNEKRFNAPITRAESMVLLQRAMEAIYNDIKFKA